MEENQIHPEETGLADELGQYFQYIQASQGQRFLNWLIDNLFMRYALTVLTGRLVGELIVRLFPDFAIRIAYEQTTLDVLLVSYIFGIFNYLIYYTICEKAFKGYTLGKLITGTRAICDDGQELTFKHAILRSLCRLVPFEAFSGFGDRPWHDSWTKTSVVKAR
ncbi:MAG: RDD family protein [Sphingobacteriales bacterium]|nr:RDD family protein [Sphingobacteriales bacterium]